MNEVSYMPQVYCHELFLPGSTDTWRIACAVEFCLAILLCLYTPDIAVELSSRHERNLEILTKGKSNTCSLENDLITVRLVEKSDAEKQTTKF